jgi:cytochrome c-type biogenesis protein CcmH
MNSETPISTDMAAPRHQLLQLKALHDDGTLGDDVYAQSRAELERALVDSVMAAPPQVVAAQAHKPSRRLLLSIAAFVALVAAGGYAWLGSPRMISVGPGELSATAAMPGSQAHSTAPNQISAMVAQLARRLDTSPGDAEGWAMLARSYAVLGRQANAVDAYARAVALRADDAALLADYADALATKDGHGLAGEPMKLVAQALKLDPANVKARSLAATDAFDRHDYAQAVQHWEQVVSAGPADSPLVAQARSGIDEARELGKLPPAAVDPAPAAVTGTVALDAALAGQVSPEDTVFITARAVNGPRMPVAALRKQVKDLPLTFRLDDSMAMSPLTRLSGFAQVVVSARVSKSGTAAASAGDLSGQSGAVAVGADGVRVLIDRAGPSTAP